MGNKKPIKNTMCYIFAGAPDADCGSVAFNPDRYVICADGGYVLAKKKGVKPDVIIGDFDTYTDFDELPDGCEILKYPVEKDDTDTMLAVKLALHRGYREITICGGIGGRLDHTFANIQALSYILNHGGYGRLVGDDSVAVMQGPGVKVYNKVKGCYFSIFSYSDVCTGINATGFKYPLKNAELNSGFPLGVSNEITGKSGVISLEKGMLLVVFSKDRKR